MRITVGGVLLFSGAAAFVVMGPFNLVKPDLIKNQIEGLKGSYEFIMGYFNPPKSLSLDSPEPSDPLVPVENNTVDSQPSVEVVPAVESAVSPAEVTPSVTAPAAPLVAPVPVTTAPVVKNSRVRRRRTKRAKAIPAASVVATPVGAKKSVGVKDKLVGTYVALKLKSGRDVKGIYQAKTATQYTIEIPGMGPFQYPVENVVSVTAVE